MPPSPTRADPIVHMRDPALMLKWINLGEEFVVLPGWFSGFHPDQPSIPSFAVSELVPTLPAKDNNTLTDLSIGWPPQVVV